jgi:TPR repeat protein
MFLHIFIFWKKKNQKKKQGLMYDEGKGVDQNLKTAHSWLLRAAQGGLACAQCHVAEMFESGRGVRRNLPEAIRWYRAAADQNHAEAMYNIGRLYEDGEGVAKDDKEAFQWFMRAAGQNHEDALYVVASAYEHGECGVARDQHEAAKFYRLAAIQGNVQAHFNLGILYCQGEGVPQSFVEAKKLFEVAAAQGFGCAVASLNHHIFVAAVESEIARAQLPDEVAWKNKGCGVPNFKYIYFLRQAVKQRKSLQYLSLSLSHALFLLNLFWIEFVGH